VLASACAPGNADMTSVKDRSQRDSNRPDGAAPAAWDRFVEEQKLVLVVERLLDKPNALTGLTTGGVIASPTTSPPQKPGGR
jgi:hypothetical protein